MRSLSTDAAPPQVDLTFVKLGGNIARRGNRTPKLGETRRSPRRVAKLSDMQTAWPLAMGEVAQCRVGRLSMFSHVAPLGAGQAFLSDRKN
jgi:hypothetical protein